MPLVESIVCVELATFDISLIQPDSEAERPQAKEMNNYVIDFPLFVSSRRHCQTEFFYIKNSLFCACYTLGKLAPRLVA